MENYTRSIKNCRYRLTQHSSLNPEYYTLNLLYGGFKSFLNPDQETSLNRGVGDPQTQFISSSWKKNSFSDSNRQLRQFNLQFKLFKVVQTNRREPEKTILKTPLLTPEKQNVEKPYSEALLNQFELVEQHLELWKTDREEEIEKKNASLNLLNKEYENNREVVV